MKNLLKNKLLFICVLMLTLIFAFSITHASFILERNFNTRARGMGKAFTGLSDDLGALTFNNAGLGYIDWVETNFMYADMFTGLESVDLGLKFAGIIYPLADYGTFGINWARFDAANLYAEDFFQLGYGYMLSDNISVGAGVDFLQYKFILEREREKQDNLFKEYGDSSSAVTFNLGILAYLQDYLSVGLSVRNINEPDVGLKDKDKVPREYRAGIALSMYGLLMPIDVYYRNQDYLKDEDKLGLSAGLEYLYNFRFGSLSLRAGYNKEEITCGFSFFKNKLFNVSELGVDTGIEYALAWPARGIDETNGSHQVALVFRYGMIHDEAGPDTTKVSKEDFDRRAIRKLFDDIDPRITITKGVTSFGGRSAELFIDKQNLLRLYASNDEGTSYNRAEAAAKQLTTVLRTAYNLKSKDFKLSEFGDKLYIQIRENRIACVTDDAELLKSSPKVLGNKWLKKLEKVLSAKQVIGRKREVKIGKNIVVKKVFSYTGEIGEIFINKKKVLSLYVKLDGKTPFARARAAAKILNKYIEKGAGPNSVETKRLY
ncbi:type IX secretion system membrane protein PorP/SprF, partial [bacterium]